MSAKTSLSVWFDQTAEQNPLNQLYLQTSPSAKIFICTIKVCVSFWLLWGIQRSFVQRCTVASLKLMWIELWGQEHHRTTHDTLSSWKVTFWKVAIISPGLSVSYTLISFHLVCAVTFSRLCVFSLKLLHLSIHTACISNIVLKNRASWQFSVSMEHIDVQIQVLLFRFVSCLAINQLMVKTDVYVKQCPKWPVLL